MGEPVVRVSNLSVTLNGKPVLSRVSFSVEPGELVAIIGPSGGGKTTLLKSMLGLLPWAGGQVTIFGQPPSRARRLVGYLPQQSEIEFDFPLSSLEVVGMGCLRRLGSVFSSSRARLREARRAMELLGIEELAPLRFGELSAGQRQLVLLARALVGDPKLLLLDEVASEVDVRYQHQIFDHLCNLSAERTVIITSHDLNCVAGRIPRTIALNGTVVADGPTQEVLTPRLVEKLYRTHFLFAPTARSEIAASKEEGQD